MDSHLIGSEEGLIGHWNFNEVQVMFCTIKLKMGIMVLFTVLLGVTILQLLVKEMRDGQHSSYGIHNWWNF